MPLRWGKDNSDLPKRDREVGQKKIDAQRRREDKPGGFSVTGRTGKAAEGHPDGWMTGGRDEE